MVIIAKTDYNFQGVEIVFLVLNISCSCAGIFPFKTVVPLLDTLNRSSLVE